MRIRKDLLACLFVLGLSTPLYAYNCSDVTVKIINKTNKIIHADGVFMKWEDKVFKQKDFYPNEALDLESATQNGNHDNTWAYIILTNNEKNIKSFTVVRNAGSRIGASYPPHIESQSATAPGYKVTFNNYQVEPKLCEAISEVIITE